MRSPRASTPVSPASSPTPAARGRCSALALERPAPSGYRRPPMILARPLVFSPLAGAATLPEALEDVTQAGPLPPAYPRRGHAEGRARHQGGGGGGELVAAPTRALHWLGRPLFSHAS